MKVIFNNRQVEITEINHGSSDPVDSFIEKAYYLDNEQDLTDEEMDKLGNEIDFTEEWYEHKQCQAEYLYDND